MSTPSKQFVRSQSHADQHRIDFLNSELALCFTFVFLAEIKYKGGKPESAERSIGHAEEAYATILPLVLDPKHAKHLTAGAIQAFTLELKRLREKLDELHDLCVRRKIKAAVLNSGPEHKVSDSRTAPVFLAEIA